MKGKVLHLVLKAQWYNMIESGEKREEYREMKPYWLQRLFLMHNLFTDMYEPITKEKAETLFFNAKTLKSYVTSYSILAKSYTHVCFHYGYTSHTMIFEIKKILIGRGKPKWGAIPNKDYFKIKLGKRVYDIREVTEM